MNSPSNAFLHFLYDNNIPFNVLSSGSFKSFWKSWLKGEKPLTRQNAAGAGLDKEFKAVQLALGAELERIEWVALTTDGWSGKRVSLWSVTASGIDKDWRRVLVKLGCIPVVAATHSHELLAQKIKDLLSQFGSKPEKVVSVTTDEGGAAPLIASNFVDAFEIHCGVHLLNIAQKNSIEQLNQLYLKSAVFFSSILEISSSFRHPKAAHQLVANQLATGEPLHAIQRRVVTRFNTWLAPLRSIRDSKESIRNYLFANVEAPFSDVLLRHPIEFWQFIDTMIDLFAPFEKMTLLISSEEATLDLLVASYHLLRFELSNLRERWPAVPGEADSWIRRLNIACIDLFLRNLRLKFEPFTDAELIAFVFNAYHKHRPHKDHWNSSVDSGREKLREVWQRRSQDDARAMEVVDDVQDAAVYGAEFTLPPADHRGIDELAQFFNVVPNTANALLWWKQHAILFPTLAPLARKYLNPKPSQIDSERDFNGIRLILTDLRSKLSLENVHKLSVIRPFLHTQYTPPPATRSNANRAADDHRVAAAAATRRRTVARQFADVPPNDPAPVLLDDFDEDDNVGENDQVHHVDIGDGERDSDDDFEADEEIEEFRQMEDRHVVPQQRVGRRAAPTCRLFPVGQGVFQYIARFQNIPNGRTPPTAATLFGPNARLVSEFTRVDDADGVHWLVSITDEARTVYTSAKQLLRTLGEIIQITDDMFPLVMNPNPVNDN